MCWFCHYIATWSWSLADHVLPPPHGRAHSSGSCTPPTPVSGIECRRLSIASGEFHGLFDALAHWHTTPCCGAPKNTTVSDWAAPQIVLEWAVWLL